MSLKYKIFQNRLRKKRAGLREANHQVCARSRNKKRSISEVSEWTNDERTKDESSRQAVSGTPIRERPQRLMRWNQPVAGKICLSCPSVCLPTLAHSEKVRGRKLDSRCVCVFNGHHLPDRLHRGKNIVGTLVPP